jgi:hypothetical protein
MSYLPGSTHTPRSRRDAGQPATTEALPTALAAMAPDDGQPSLQGDPLPAPMEEEPFVPKSRYVMGRSTKVMACILMVTAGLFAGSAIQKQIDAGTRAARTGTATFQGNGAGAGSGGGTQTPGQGRRNGGTGTAGAGTAGAGTAGTGTGATAGPTAGGR